MSEDNSSYELVDEELNYESMLSFILDVINNNISDEEAIYMIDLWIIKYFSDF